MSVKANAHDPRTIAREIPGVLDALFPQLTPGVVSHLNRRVMRCSGCNAVDDVFVAKSGLAKAMLFEIAVAAAEQLLQSEDVTADVDWDATLRAAISRQRKHFDAVLTTELSGSDREVALVVARNLVHSLRTIAAETASVRVAPRIMGFEWIASGNGDFSIGQKLIEVKCTRKLFSTADYRQILMYWLLSYAAAVDGGPPEWAECALVNPRLNAIVTVQFDELLQLSAGDRTKIEVLQTFKSMISDRSAKLSV